MQVGSNLPAKCSGQGSATQESSNAYGTFFRLVPESEMVDHAREHAALGRSEEESEYTNSGNVLRAADASADSAESEDEKSEPSD